MTKEEGRRIVKRNKARRNLQSFIVSAGCLTIILIAFIFIGLYSCAPSAESRFRDEVAEYAVKTIEYNNGGKAYRAGITTGGTDTYIVYVNYWDSRNIKTKYTLAIDVRGGKKEVIYAEANGVKIPIKKY